MILTVGNTKGGVGKTTLALNLAISRALDGRDVWLIDGDRQGSATTSVDIRADAGHLPGIPCSSYPDGKSLKAQLLLQKDKYQDVVIDAGGRDSTALRSALLCSDVLLVPFQPRSYDVWALDQIATLAEEAREFNERLRCFAVLNFADPGEGSTDNTEAAEALSNVPGLEYLPVPIRRRKAFADAAGAGLSVLEQKPRNAKAAEELLALARLLFT